MDLWPCGFRGFGGRSRASLRWNLRNNSCNQPCLLGFIRRGDSRREDDGMCCPAVPTDLCSCLWHSLICRATRCCSEQKAKQLDAEIQSNKSADTVSFFFVFCSRFVDIDQTGSLAHTVWLNPNVRPLKPSQTLAICTVVTELDMMMISTSSLQDSWATRRRLQTSLVSLDTDSIHTYWTILHSTMFVQCQRRLYCGLYVARQKVRVWRSGWWIGE